MKIGVYRIYLSVAAAQGDVKARLLRAFDAIPEFLYRLDQVEFGLLTEAGTDVDARRRVLRLAMTPSHVAITDADVAPGACETLLGEVVLARTGFRRRIPVLGITQGVPGEAPAAALCDRVVTLAGDDIACAIQELAESSAFRITEAADARPNAPDRLATTQVDVTAGVRPLPMQGIAEAFATLQAQRAKHRN